MSNANQSETPRNFADVAQRTQPGLFRQFGLFLKSTGKWWLIPVFVALAVAALLIALGSTAAAPFIYTIF